MESNLGLGCFGGRGRGGCRRRCFHRLLLGNNLVALFFAISDSDEQIDAVSAAAVICSGCAVALICQSKFV